MCFTLCFSVFANAEETPTATSEEIINTVKLLEIANGDENGNMNYDRTVTRAEFIKMAVSTSPYKERAKSYSVSYSLFPDVTHSFWGAGYISEAIEHGLVNGYLDGTFRPNNDVTLEEAVTIALRLLGYTSSDFKGSYPASQLEKYHELKLDDGITAEKGKKLTREECMLLLYNTLCTKTKSGTIYCTTLGYTADTNDKIDYGALLESKLDGPVIKTDGDGFSELDGFTANNSTQYQLNNSRCDKAAIKAGDALYYSDKINAVFAFRKTATGIVSSFSSDGRITLIGGKNYSTSTTTAKNKLSLGGSYSSENAFVTLVLGLNDAVIDVKDGNLSLLDENSDNASYIAMLDATLSVPIYLGDDNAVNLWKSKIPFDTSAATVYINGVISDTYSPAVYDVLYYSVPFNSIWIYRETESGTITSIGSSSVTVGAKMYGITTNEANFKISAYGDCKVDSYVTLILGKDKAVIDIINNKSSSSTTDSTIEATISLPVYIKNEEIKGSWASELPFKLDDAVTYLNGVENENVEIQIRDVVYYSTQYKSVWVFRKTVNGIIGSVNSTNLTIGTKVYSLGTTEAKNKVSDYGLYSADDYVTLVLGKGDEVIDIFEASLEDIGKTDDDSSYSDIIAGSLKGPYVVSAEGKTEDLTIALEKATVFYLNNVVSYTDIQPYDVYYFSPVLNTVWIYRDSVSGTIEEMTPSAAPTTVVMSGKTYSIESANAAYDLSSFGSYGIGDKATFLLGMDGKVAGVVSVDEVSKTFYAVVTGRGSKEFKEKNGKTYTADYVTVTDLSCNTYTYEHENRTLGIGDIVRVIVGDTVKITEQSTSIGKAGLATVVNALNNGKFASDCKIIEINGSTAKKVYPSRFDGVKLGLDSFLYTSSVLHYKTNSEGELCELILNNFTGDLMDYGVVTASNSSQITYMTENSKRTFAASGVSCSTGPAAIITTDGTVTGIKSLVGEVEDLDYVTKKAVYDEDGKEYLLSEDVKVYVYYADSYKLISIDDAVAGKYNFSAFYDKTPENGGRIRVIIATKA